MKPISRKDDLVIQETPDELLVYDLRLNKAICLNSTSVSVWKACNGKRTPKMIAGELEKAYKSSVEEDLVWVALDQLAEHGLLENEIETNARFEGMSRRQVMKRIGIASALALPIVTGLIAPVAVHAQGSCNSVGCVPSGLGPCMVNSDCCVGAMGCVCSTMKVVTGICQ